jgi:hypothetical protein
MPDDHRPQPRSRPKPDLLFPELYTEEHRAKRRAAVARVEGNSWKGVDATDPQCPAGHAKALRISVTLTSDFRQTHRKGAMDIKPQDVIDVLIAAGVKKWVLMGLHGYAGYLPQPRATQDVDVLISRRECKKAVQALRAAWPSLAVEEFEPVIRFKDPADCFPDGSPKPVIDLMLPGSPLNEAILKEKDFVVVDSQTQHVIPTVEAALASKYAAMISDLREWEKKQQDAVDFRRIARANYDRVDRERLRRLGELIWQGGGEELEEFLDIAPRDEPFPV